MSNCDIFLHLSNSAYNIKMLDNYTTVYQQRRLYTVRVLRLGFDHNTRKNNLNVFRSVAYLLTRPRRWAHLKLKLSIKNHILLTVIEHNTVTERFCVFCLWSRKKIQILNQSLKTRKVLLISTSLFLRQDLQSCKLDLKS